MANRNKTIWFGRNSWSDQWGESGDFCIIHEDYKNYLIEAITFTDIPNSKIEETKKLPEEPKKFRYQFQKNMSYGERNDDILNLQRALKILGYFDATPTGYYGEATKKAVLKFQLDKKVASAVTLYWYGGKYAHDSTRKALNKIFQ